MRISIGNEMKGTTMRFSGLVVAGAVAAGVLALPAYAKRDISGTADATCRLVNTQHDKDLYNGDCTVKQTIKNDQDGKRTIWDIKMGSAQSFLFACSPDGQCMHGPEEVRFKDQGQSGTFRWGDFKLKVVED
jgi:hypothetical protein